MPKFRTSNYSKGHFVYGFYLRYLVFVHQHNMLVFIVYHCFVDFTATETHCAEFIPCFFLMSFSLLLQQPLIQAKHRSVTPIHMHNSEWERNERNM